MRQALTVKQLEMYAYIVIQMESQITLEYRKPNYHIRGYSRVTFPEIVLLEENPIIKLIVEDKVQTFAYCSGDFLPVAKSCHHLFGYTIQWKVKRRKTYCSTNFIRDIISTY